MQLRRRVLLHAATAALLLSARGAIRAESIVVDAAALAALYRVQVDKRLEVPPQELSGYARLAEEALAKAGTPIARPQYLAVVDRDPLVQAIVLLWRAGPGQYEWVGASPVATGRPGSFEHFKTPLGVFGHSLANPDFRAEGTRNANGIRGYGDKGMRVFDFGWQRVAKGWGDGAVSDMRLQMHATVPAASILIGSR